MNSISEFVAQPQSGNAELTGALPPVRVLHINSGNLYGGVETILVTLARLRHLCPAMEMEFALCHEGRLSQELEAAGATVHITGKVRISRPWTVWRARRRLREILRTGSFGVVICHMPWALAVFGPTVLESGQALGFWAHAFHAGLGWLERLAKRSVPRVVIANSRFTDEGLKNLFPGVQGKVIYPPLPLVHHDEAAQWRSTIRKEFGINDETVVIIQVSRIEKCKGHLLHLDALALLKGLPERWVCWMAVGAQRPEEQAYLSKLQELTLQLDLSERVKFLGQRSDISKLLAAADVFCQPNESPDSFGLAFVEALWAERPVITVALGGAVEVVDPSCGVTVSPGDTEGLVQALKQLIQNAELRNRLGRAGTARALQLCDPVTQMKALSEIARSARRRHDT